MMKNKNSLKISFPGYVAFMFIFFISSSCSRDKSHQARNYKSKVTDLKCEYATNPIGPDVQSLQLSWCIESGKMGAMNSHNHPNMGSVGFWTYHFKSDWKKEDSGFFFNNWSC